MKARWTGLSLLMALWVGVIVVGCGGGGGGGPSGPNVALVTPTPLPGTANVMPVAVAQGPYGGTVNQIFVSVRLCAPNGGNCQTIPGILLDTGSFGLRLFSQTVQVPLAPENEGVGQVGECAVFASGGVAWGPVVNAEVGMGSEPLAAMPVQLIASSSFAPAPTSCSNLGQLFTTPQAARANGILGVGLFPTDHGAGIYYSCASAVCTPFQDTPNQDVANPVAALPVDNNGLIVQLPAIGSQGAASAAGVVLFGIGTQANNGLGAATVYTANSVGNFTTMFNNQSLPNSFIDTGSNGLFFVDASIPACRQNNFFCPGSTLSLSAQNVGTNGAAGTVAFQIANASNLFSTGNLAFDNLGGAFRGGTFDWGMPFFFGRSVYVGIAGAGASPYWAY